MNSWHAGDLAVHGLRMHYTRTGGLRPPLVLAHGVGDDGLCWTTVAEALAPDYDVVMVDARGHGRSAAPDEGSDAAAGYGPAVQAQDLAGLLAALGLRDPSCRPLHGRPDHAGPGRPRPPAAPGHPPGRPPGGVDAWAPRRAGAPSRPALMRGEMGALKRKTRAELIAGQRAVAAQWPDAELERWADSKHRFSPGVLELFAEPVGAGLDWPALLPRIACPALLLTADPARGAIGTAESAAALQALVPRLRVAHIPDAGHSMRHDQLARYLAAVRAFLAELPAPAG